MEEFLDGRANQERRKQNHFWILNGDDDDDVEDTVPLTSFPITYEVVDGSGSRVLNAASSGLPQTPGFIAVTNPPPSDQADHRQDHQCAGDNRITKQ